MRSNRLLIAIVGSAVLSLWSCSGSDTSSPTSTGGSQNAVGGDGTQAGTAARGGASSVGGAGGVATTSVGGSATGGNMGIGGKSLGTGGKASGGNGATGGRRATGGSKATGGGNTVGGSSTAGGSTGDPYTTSRQLCVDTINSFRATLGLAPLVAWPAINTCVDGQSTADETAATAHSAFGNCGENAQDECLGSKNTSQLVSCLTSMWNEKNDAACTGCDACSAAPWRTCANCDYETCGHYVNMSAQYYTQVSCGFSSLGGWSTQDFK